MSTADGANQPDYRYYPGEMDTKSGGSIAGWPSRPPTAQSPRAGQKSEMEVATAIQQCYRHVFYPSRLRCPAARLTLPMPPWTSTARERPGSGQQQIVRTLRESANQKLRLSEDPPESPGYIRDRTPLKKGQISTAALRDEFRKDPALSIHAHDFVLIRAITQGIQQGDYVYRRNESLCGPDDPMASIIIDEQSFTFTMQFAKEKTSGRGPFDGHPVPQADLGMTGGRRQQAPGHHPRRRPAAAGSNHRRRRLESRAHRTLGKGAQGRIRPGQVLSIRLFDATDAFRMLGRRERRKRFPQKG